MRTQPQWCDDKAGPDFGKIGGPHLNVYSHAERRYDCTTCSPTVHADRGTFFDTVRTDRQGLLHAVALLVERPSLRAICRSTQGQLATALHWFDLAGQQAAAVSPHGMKRVQLPQAQLEERWTLIKHHRTTVTGMIPRISATPGCGKPARCPVACVLCLISLINVVSQKRSPAEPNVRPERMVDPPAVLPTNCQPRSLPSAPMTAPLNPHLSTAGLVVRARPRVGDALQRCVLPRLPNVVSQGGVLTYGGESSVADLPSSLRCVAANT